MIIRNRLSKLTDSQLGEKIPFFPRGNLKLRIPKTVFFARLLILFILFQVLPLKTTATNRRYLDSCENLLKTSLSANHKLMLYYTLSYEYGLLNPRKGIAYANKCMDLAIKSKNEIGKHFAYNAMGNAYESMANFDSALWCHFNSYKYAKTFGDYVNQTSSLVNIGICYKEQGNYAEALKYFLQGYKVVENRKVYNARIHYYLGEMYYMLGNYKEAIIHSKKGYNRLINSNSEYIAYNMHVVLAKCKLKLGEIDSAIIILKHATSKLQNYTDKVRAVDSFSI